MCVLSADQQTDVIDRDNCSVDVIDLEVVQRDSELDGEQQRDLVDRE